MSPTPAVGTLTDLGNGLGNGLARRPVLHPLRGAAQGISLVKAQGATVAQRGAKATGSLSPRERKLQQAAGQFESMLLSNLWKSMKSAFEDEDSEYSDPGHGAMDEWGMDAMASAVGKNGGLGIAKLIMKDLAPEVTGHGVPEGGAKVKALTEYRR
jgi:peptidoglycan hydrolase FlgJ